MGRGGKKGHKNHGGGRGEWRDNRVSYDKIEKTNPSLEQYYNTVLNLSETEKTAFWAALRRELPNSFRFAGFKNHALAVQRLLRERYIPEIMKIEHNDGTKADPPEPVPWYPDGLAWWMTTPKAVVRRFPPFAEFQKYLVSETSVGNISRQEVVSMIPPLLMDVEPGMAVLDMCAAPGSKAAQLLEMLHRGEEIRMREALKNYAKDDGREASPSLDVRDNDSDIKVDLGDYGRATGLLIANDSDSKRSHLLIHQLKRLSSPNLIVTNHDATMFPSIKLPSLPEAPSANRYLKFDRILADVPCSGDGTCRKNPNLWHDWSPGNALGLHTMQVKLLVRALQMLKVGGRVVYSTCSMNPVENEAVVSSAIRRAGGLASVQLLDCSDRLPQLKRSPGLTRWNIMDKSGRIWSDWESVAKQNENYGSQTSTARLVEDMFVPGDKNNTEKIPLERCIRVYPHQQDTGGFFIAVLQKMKEFKARAEADFKKSEDMSPNLSIAKEYMSSSVPVQSGDTTSEAKTGNGNGYSPVAEQNQETPDYKKPISLKHDLESGTETRIAKKKIKTTDDIDTVRVENMETAKIEGKNTVKTENMDIVEVGDMGPVKVEDMITAKAEDMDDQQTSSPPYQDIKLNFTKVPYNPLMDNSVAPSNQPSEQTSNRQGKFRPRRQPFEEPFKYISPNHAEVRSIETFYNISPRFPRDRFMVRNVSGDPAKTIYYTSASVRDILVENEGRGIKFVHGGVRMFMKQDVQGKEVCKWRIQHEGMPILEGYVGEERVVRLYRKQTLRKLLIEMFPKIDGTQNLGEVGKRVGGMTMGCCVLRIEPSDQEDGFEERMVLPLWRSQFSLNLMLAKEDRTAMLLRIFNDSTPLVNNHYPKKANSRKDQEGSPEDEMCGREIDPGQSVNSAPKLDVVDSDLDVEIVLSSNGQKADVEDSAKCAETPADI